MKLSVYDPESRSTNEIQARLDQIDAESKITEIRLPANAQNHFSFCAWTIRNKRRFKILPKNDLQLTDADAVLLFTRNDAIELEALARGLPVYEGEIL